MKSLNTIDELRLFVDKAIYPSHSLIIRPNIWDDKKIIFIGELSRNLAKRLSTPCPKCENPGWGKVNTLPGLECAWCGLATDIIKTEIFGCQKCDYQKLLPRTNGLLKADPENCLSCNP